MSLNPISLIARAFYTPFKSAILSAWNAAREDAFAEIRAGLPTDGDAAEVANALAEIRGQQLPAIDDEPAKRRGKKS